MTSPESQPFLHDEVTDEPDDYTSDYSNFVENQIEHLIQAERQRNSKLTRIAELEIATQFCKNYLLETNDIGDKEKRAEVMAKLVDLKLEQDQIDVRVLIVFVKF